MIEINRKKCIACLKCISACPFKVLGIVDEKPDPGEGKMCIKCLHCAAVCPQDAISLDGNAGILEAELPERTEEQREIVEMNLLMRRSYRQFKPIPVPVDILQEALRIAAWAPSAKNQHPTKWIVINNEDTIREIMDSILEYVKETHLNMEIVKLYRRGHNVVMGNAKTLILAYAGSDAINPSVDSALAIYNAELVLQSRGLGTCWAGYLTRLSNQIPAVKELIQLPEGCSIYGALMAGYPDHERYLHIPNRIEQPEVKWL